MVVTGYHRITRVFFFSNSYERFDRTRWKFDHVLEKEGTAPTHRPCRPDYSTTTMGTFVGHFFGPTPDKRGFVYVGCVLSNVLIRLPSFMWSGNQICTLNHTQKVCYLRGIKSILSKLIKTVGTRVSIFQLYLDPGPRTSSKS